MQARHSYHISNGQNVYFISDIHLGFPNYQASLARERKLVSWLNAIKQNAAAIYIVGDLFDFWFEYSSVVPKGYVRTLGTLASLSDQGIPIYFFTGNHDLWMFGYFEKELSIPVYKKPICMHINNKHFFIGHGDGLGPKDIKYKLVKKYLFNNKLCQWLLARLHPNFTVGFATYLSRLSRKQNGQKDRAFLGEHNEWLIQYAKRKLQARHYDYFIFGHRHLPIVHQLPTQSTYINLGDWINYFTYAYFDGQDIHLCQYNEQTTAFHHSQYQ